jgi:hypothetical protein
MVILITLLVIDIILLILTLRFDMTKKDKKLYSQDHKLAKFICAIINTFLFVSILEIDKPVLFFLVNLTYFFGANTLGYIIETVRGHKHKHDVI